MSPDKDLTPMDVDNHQEPGDEMNCNGKDVGDAGESNGGMDEQQTNRESGKREPPPGNPLLDDRQMLLRRLLNNDEEDEFENKRLMFKFADYMDDTASINNWAKEAVALSKKCKNIRKVESKFESNLGQLLGRLELQNLIPEEIPMPESIDVPVAFQVPPSVFPGTRSSSTSVTATNNNSLVQSKITSFLRQVDRPSGRNAFAQSQPNEIEEVDQVTYNGRGKKSAPSMGRGGGRGQRRKRGHEDDYEEEPFYEDPDEPKDIITIKSAKDLEIEQRHRRMKSLGKWNPPTKIMITESVSKPFVPPSRVDHQTESGGGEQSSSNSDLKKIMADPRMKSIDEKLADRVLKEIVDQNSNVSWDDIAGLEAVKRRMQEMVVLPMRRPDLFKGLRAPGKGVLLFGPPGTGKTMIGKCIASQCGATFFSISASSLTSKWIGEGEKTVRAMFTIARVLEPTVIFIDEIDSLLSQRNAQDHEVSRKMKTEFLLRFDGIGSNEEDRLLIIGATNRPSELDEAARRRFTRRLYIPLPDVNARITIVRSLLKGSESNLTEEEFRDIANKTDGFSGADMATLCKEAAMFPVRDVMEKQIDIEKVTGSDIRPVQYSDFLQALKNTRPSVSPSEIVHYAEFNINFGSF